MTNVPKPQRSQESEPDQQQEEHESPPLAKREIGGRVGPEPTRFGDWEKNGRCIDF